MKSSDSLPDDLAVHVDPPPVHDLLPEIADLQDSRLLAEKVPHQRRDPTLADSDVVEAPAEVADEDGPSPQRPVAEVRRFREWELQASNFKIKFCQSPGSWNQIVFFPISKVA